MPWLTLMCCIGAALHQGLTDLAVAMLLQFVSYLRPGEFLSLTPEGFAVPSSHTRTGRCGCGLCCDISIKVEQRRATSSTRR